MQDINISNSTILGAGTGTMLADVAAHQNLAQRSRLRADADDLRRMAANEWTAHMDAFDRWFELPRWRWLARLRCLATARSHARYSLKFVTGAQALDYLLVRH